MPPFHVLIAEEESHLRATFAKAFRNTGFEVTVAIDGYSALHSLRRAMPHVMVLDTNLRRPSSLDVIGYVRQQQPGYPVQIIAVINNELDVDNDGLQLADLILMKPINTRDLLSLTQRLLRSVRGRVPAAESR